MLHLQHANIISKLICACHIPLSSCLLFRPPLLHRASSKLHPLSLLWHQHHHPLILSSLQLHKSFRYQQPPSARSSLNDQNSQRSRFSELRKSSLSPLEQSDPKLWLTTFARRNFPSDVLDCYWKHGPSMPFKPFSVGHIFAFSVFLIKTLSFYDVIIFSGIFSHRYNGGFSSSEV